MPTGRSCCLIPTSLFIGGLSGGLPPVPRSGRIGGLIPMLGFALIPMPGFGLVPIPRSGLVGGFLPRGLVSVKNNAIKYQVD